MKVVLVEWLDSAEPADNADLELHEIPDPQRLQNVGWLLKDEESYVSLVSGLKPELETFDYAISIPKCSIIQMRELK
jgi:hypothetical protein